MKNAEQEHNERRPDPGYQLASTFPRLLATIPQVSGHLTSGDRVGTWVFTVTTVATQDTQVKHGLGRVPNGYIVIRSSGGFVSDASDGMARWTDALAYVKASAVGTYAILWL